MLRLMQMPMTRSLKNEMVMGCLNNSDDDMDGDADSDDNDNDDDVENESVGSSATT